MQDNAQPRQFDFRHASFTTCEDGLCFFAASHSTVVVGNSLTGQVSKLCQITFNKNGSVFAQFTYFGQATGVVAAYVLTPGQTTHKVLLAESGLLASVPVKYSHPPSGNAHFSQDGRVVSKIRRQSFELAASEGHLFELHAWYLHAFEQIKPGEEKLRRLYLPWLFNGPFPEGVALAVEWRRKTGLRSLKPTAAASWGPLVELPRWTDGQLFKAMLVGQPAGYALQDHVLVINVGAIPKPPSLDRPSTVFFGGWDEHEQSKNPAVGTGYLTFLYPAGSADDLKQAGRTVDWEGGESATRDGV
jgi:hypothetical protein